MIENKKLEKDIDAFWKEANSYIKKGKTNLGCNIIYIYKDVWEGIEKKLQQFTNDMRREWEEVTLQQTDQENFLILEFAAHTRDTVFFLIEKVDEIDDCLILRAYYLVPQKLMKSTLFALIKNIKGAWFPRLRYGFMEDFINYLYEIFPNAKKIELKDFLTNVIEKEVINKKQIIHKKTMRIWVDTDGNREYDLIKKWNAQDNRIVTLKAMRIVIDFENPAKMLDFRLDNTSRMVLSSPNLEGFKKINDFILAETKKEFQKFLIKQRIKIGTLQTEKNGRQIFFVDYGGTDNFEIKITKKIPNWFERLYEIFTDDIYLIKKENIIPFIVSQDINPFFQLKLIDIEEQSITNLTLLKDYNLIRIAPEGLKTNVNSVSKIYNIIEGVLGTTFHSE